VVRVGGVHGHQNRVEGMAVDALHQRVGAVVAGDAEMAHDLLLLHFEQRFHRAALGEDFVHIGHGADVVQLPEVDVIGLEQLQRLLDHAHGAVAGALLGLGGEEGLVAAVGHHLADVLLAPALGAAVDRRGVDVVDAEVERALDDGHGDVEVVGLLERGLAAEREDADLVAGLAEVAGGHGRAAGFQGRVCVLCFSVNMVWSRVLMRTETPESLTLFSGVVQIVVGAALMLAWHAEPVTPRLGVTLAAMGLFCAFGSMCFFVALQHTSPVHVSQCHYTQLVTGALLTWLIWRETPTVWMLAGSALIVAAGLLMAMSMTREDPVSNPEIFVGPG
jgi:uncharacterized membrane protein